MATDVYADVIEEINGELETLRRYVVEGGKDAEVAELKTSIEASITNGFKGNTKAAVSNRKDYRAQLADALKAPTSTELAKAGSADVDAAADLSDVEDSIALAAESYLEVTKSQVKGTRQIGEVLFAMRLRVSAKDEKGPDIMGNGKKYKNAVEEVNRRVLAPLEGESSELAEDLRDQVKRLRSTVANHLQDIRVEYARALDTSTDEQREPFATILAENPDLKPSVAVAKHYGFALSTRAELARADRETKKAIEAKRESGEELTEEEREVIGDKVPVTPADNVRAVITGVTRVVELAAKRDGWMGIEESERKTLAAALEVQIAELTLMVKELG
jgi:hypothetical protein